MSVARFRRHPFACHLAALLLALLYSLIITYPMVLHFTTEAVGEDYPDRVQNMWNLWWAKVALLDQHSSPFHTHLLFWPYGADLYFHDLALPSTLAALIPQLTLGLVAAFNFSVLFALVMSAYAGFRLVYYLTRSCPGGLVGGTIIGFNTLQHFSTRAQTNILSIQWFVLCIEFYLRAWERGRRRDGILAGLFFTLSVLTIGYFEIYLLIFFAVHALWLLVTIPGATAGARLGAILRRARPVLVWAGGTAVLLTGPYALAAWRSLQTGLIAPHSPVDAQRTLLNSADVVSLFVPYREGRLLGQAAPWWTLVDPQIHDHLYLGLVGLALAAGGVWAWRRGRGPGLGLWIAVGLVGVILALGPVLQINGRQTFAGLTVPLPFALVQDIPPFALVRFPERFLNLTYVALGVLAGGAVAALLAGRTPAPVLAGAGPGVGCAVPPCCSPACWACCCSICPSTRG